MSRDPSKLKVFTIADQLVIKVYTATREFPIEERFALQSQIRRAAVSVPTNMVEGCARRSRRDYVHFMAIALGSASEVRYLLGLAARLGYLAEATATELAAGYSDIVRGTQALIGSLSGPEA